MRHRKSFNHLGRTTSHRSAMLANMAASLILHKRIETTTAKAKALRSYVEPIINKSKEDTTHSRRVVFSYLQNKEAVSELFREVAAKVHDRPGGYTRILKLGTRIGDSAEMCIMELVDYNENLLGETTTKTKTGRRRRGGKKKDQGKEISAAVPVTGGHEQKTDQKVPSDVNPETAAPNIADNQTVEDTDKEEVSGESETVSADVSETEITGATEEKESDIIKDESVENTESNNTEEKGNKATGENKTDSK